MWWLLILASGLARAESSATCSDLLDIYQANCQSCRQTTDPITLCGVGTEWSASLQQCVIAAMTVRPYGRRDEEIPIHLGSLKTDSAWHTCTCMDGSTYQCQSKYGDGAKCCDRSMAAICGEGNVDMRGYKFHTGAWHTCTCADGSTYQCQSNRGDGSACCDRSMPAICGENNVPSSRTSEWHVCTCEDGTTYECKSSHGDGSACCDRSMPAMCASSVPVISSYDMSDVFDAVYSPPTLPETTKRQSTWHTCTCRDGSTYECKSNYNDGSACCDRSMPAICGEDNVPDTTVIVSDPPLVNIGIISGGWHVCTCADGSTYECQSNRGDGAACCSRSKPAICGENNT